MARVDWPWTRPVSTIVYLRPDLLDELQAAARRRDTTAWRMVESVLEKALKADRAK